MHGARNFFLGRGVRVFYGRGFGNLECGADAGADAGPNAGTSNAGRTPAQFGSCMIIEGGP